MIWRIVDVADWDQTVLAATGEYSLIFRPLPEAPRQVQLRFHGLSFGARARIKVEGAEWTLTHDVPVPLGEASSQTSRPRLRNRFSTAPTMPQAQDGAASEVYDASKLVGLEGGCTLTLSLEPDAAIVQVALTKEAPKDSEGGVNYLVQIGAAMTQAMASSLLSLIIIMKQQR